jgi:hypothetical protein
MKRFARLLSTSLALKRDKCIRAVGRTEETPLSQARPRSSERSISPLYEAAQVGRS